MGITLTPLRYPGGKSCLAGYFAELFKLNNLNDGHYAEAYCGGAGVALELLFREAVRTIHINDADPAIASFWRSVVNSAEDLCDRIDQVALSVSEWDKQKQILKNRYDRRYSDLTLGFAAFYLNRMNRSGILNGGIIGGRSQSGPWKMDARFNRADLIRRVATISAYSDRIHVYQEDALKFLKKVEVKLSEKGLIYFDPPYFDKGQYLYLNYYKEDDHAALAKKISELEVPWVVSYDNAEKISALYKGYRQKKYALSYSALKRTEGSELMIYSDGLVLPNVSTPVSYGVRVRSRTQRRKAVA